MNTFIISIFFLMKIGNISAFIPDNGVHVQTIEGDCTGDGKDEVVLVYDLGGRFGTEEYRRTCVDIIEKTEDGYSEVYKSKLSADTKVRFVKIFDELPTLVEIQWFHSAGGGNTYICYDKKLKRFREILSIESGGLNRKDIDGDGTEEVFSFKFEEFECPQKDREIYGGFLTFFRWERNCFEFCPKKPFMMRPGITYFATNRGFERPNLFMVSPKHLNASSYKGPQDLSFSFYAFMDLEVLSISIIVTDDMIAQEGEGKEIIYGDHIILLLDTELESDFCSGEVNSDDVALAISPGNLINIPPDIVNLNPSSKLSEDIAEKGDILLEKQDNGYKVTLRFYFPKETLARKLFGFGIIVYDRDRMDTKYPEFKMSWPPDLNKKDPTTWGNLYHFEE
jgi:hypothetical protein